MNKRILLGASALVLVATPAVVGLWGNASFAQSVPVRVPASVATASPTAMPSPTATPSPSASIDDHGGDVPRDQRVEPGDDRRTGGSDDSGSSGSGSGRGSDDSGSGHGGHGGDD